MKETAFRPRVIALFLAALLVCASCSPKEDEIPGPSPTAPLSRPALGYGIVAVSYIRVMNEPGPEGVSLGFVRSGAVFKALERKLVKIIIPPPPPPPDAPPAGNAVSEPLEKTEYWILAEGAYTGWLPESAVQVFETSEKAETAAKKMAESGSPDGRRETAH